MAKKRQRINVNSKSSATPGSPARQSSKAVGADDLSRILVPIACVVVVIVAAIAIGFVALRGGGSAAAATPSAAVLAEGEAVHQAQGGSWIDITPDRLAAKMQAKDFTLLNVKTPYIGEIDGTDLYIPYDQVAARAGELPASKDAKIVVYCRSGVESAQAAQTLLNLGYKNIWNLDGGMNAWTGSGRALVQKVR